MLVISEIFPEFRLPKLGFSLYEISTAGAHGSGPAVVLLTLPMGVGS